MEGLHGRLIHLFTAMLDICQTWVPGEDPNRFQPQICLAGVFTTPKNTWLKRPLLFTLSIREPERSSSH